MDDRPSGNRLVLCGRMFSSAKRYTPLLLSSILPGVRPSVTWFPHPNRSTCVNDLHTIVYSRLNRSNIPTPSPLLNVPFLTHRDPVLIFPSSGPASHLDLATRSNANHDAASRLPQRAITLRSSGFCSPSAPFSSPDSKHPQSPSRSSSSEECESVNTSSCVARSE